MRKHGGTDPIEYRSCGCSIKNDDHLFQCPRQPQFLRHIQSIINDIQDTLNPKLYHLLKHHLTAYIQGNYLLSTTTMALTHKCRVSRPSLPQSHLKHLNLDTNPYVDSVPHHPSRLIHNPYIFEIEYPYKEYHQLLMKQQQIGWDSFLCRKISKQWQIYQHNYEQTQYHHQRILKCLREFKNLSLLKKKKKRKKKKPPNVFQTLISSIFTAAHKEIWAQHNKEHHGCNSSTSATAVKKIDKQVQLLYNKIDYVLTYKRDKYFPITLEQRLQQSFKKKQQCVICWRVRICNNEKRAKKEAANKTLPIWQYFTKHKKPDSPTMYKPDRINIIKETERFAVQPKSSTTNAFLPYFLLLLWTNWIVALQHYNPSAITM